MDRERNLRTEVAKFAVPGAILAVGVIGFLALGSKPPVPTRKTDGGVPLVKTIPVAAHDEGLDIEVEGHVVPYREISLAAEVPGRIVRKAEVCRPGKYVTEGTTLIEIDPRDYQIEKRLKEEELEQARVSIRELRVEIENTGSLVELADSSRKLQANELKRLEKLAEKNEGYVTDSQLDQEKRNVLTAENAYLTLKSQLDVLKSRLAGLESAEETARTRLEKAELDLARTKITAPIDGVIVLEEVEEDSYVNKGTLLVAIEDTSAVEVKCNLRMDELYWLWCQAFSKEKRSSGDGPPQENGPRNDYQIPKTPVTVIYSLADLDSCWEGELSRYEGFGLDEATRTVPCRVLVEDPRKVRVVSADGRSVPKDVETFLAQGPPALVRGMYVTVHIHATPHVPLFSLPERAIQPGNEVWRVRGDTLNTIDVRVVDIRGKVATVRAGEGDLKVGDKLVVSPMALVRDGMKVRIEGSEPPKRENELPEQQSEYPERGGK